MPELPEVEVASRHLRSWLGGRRIVRARAAVSRILRGQSPARFATLAGHRLEFIERRGKWLVLGFDGGEGLVSHLGMTGKWVRRKRDEQKDPYTRATVELDDGYAVDYRDPRLFGLLLRGKLADLRQHPTLASLGPDPLAGADATLLHAALRKTRRSLKEALMDQRTIAGLGNIYVGESLHRARLDPRRSSATLRAAESERLAQAIDASLRAALQHEDGPEPITYVEEGGRNVFLVYDREGQPCASCQAPIVRIVQGGRSTFYCPRCQAGRRRAAKPHDDAKRRPMKPRGRSGKNG